MSDKEASTSGIVATTTPVVQAFPALTEARKFKSGGRESGEPKYSDSFVFDPASPDLQRLKAAAVAQAQAKWPGRDIGAEFKAGTFAMPFTSGNGIIAKTKAKAEAAGKEYEGKADFMKDKIIIKASSKYPPRLAYIENGKISPVLEGPALAANKNKFFFGAEVLFEVNLVAYDKVGERGVDGVTAYLNQVLTTGKGKRLSGGSDPADTFAGYAGKLSQEDPTKGLDDGLPF